MKFIKTKIPGVHIIDPEKKIDNRGFFARSYCQKEYRQQGINSKIYQCSISFNKCKGTLRGLHYQVKPFAEDKIVRCTRGKIFDVVLDLRENSRTYLKYTSSILSYKNHKAIYIPKGCAHGYLTLEDNTEVFYQMTQIYSEKHARGARWNDPAFNIKWPKGKKIISKKDKNYQDFL